METIAIKPRVNVTRSMQMIFGEGKLTPSTLIEALRELISNCFDAGAPKVNITYSPREHVIRIEDNGNGFISSGRNGFFWLYDSPKRDGDQVGDVTGLHGTGRTKALKFADEIAWTCPKDIPGKCLKAELTRDVVVAISTGDTTERHWQQVKKPAWWPKFINGTGSVIELRIKDDEKWKKLPSEKDVRNALALQFRPSDANRVTVNDKTLPARTFVQGTSLLTKTFSVDELTELIGAEHAKALGKCEIELFMPEKPTRHDGISLGSRNPICTISEFVSELPQVALQGVIPQQLLGGGIAGVIFVSNLNKHVHENRKELLATAYQGLHKSIVRLIAEGVGPLAKEEFSRREEAAAKAKRKHAERQTFGEMVAAFGASGDFEFLDVNGPPSDEQKEGGKQGAKKRTPQPLELESGSFEILMGDTATIEVSRYEGIDPANLVWDFNGVADLVEVNGTQIQKTVSARKVGQGEFSVATKDGKHRATAKLKIVASRELMVTPRRIEIQQGRSRKFYARNIEATSGQLGWKVAPRNGITLSNVSGNQTVVEVQDDCPTGEFTLTVYDATNTEVSGTATFMVTTGEGGKFIQLDEYVYQLASGDPNQQTLVNATPEVKFARRGKKKIGIMFVNMAHREIELLRQINGDDSGQRLLIVGAMLNAHLAALTKMRVIKDPAEVPGRYDALKLQYLERRAKQVK